MEKDRAPVGLFVGLFLAALVVRSVTLALLHNAGYFDGYYYFGVAENMLAGRGLSEDFIWNYLDDSPASMALPHPSHGYWMPIPTLLAWIGMRAFGTAMSSFHAAAAPFVVLSALLPAMSAWIAWRLWRRRDHALVAGLLTLFASTYFVRWVTPETFSPFAVALFLAFVGASSGAAARTGGGAIAGWLAAGVGSGLAHLTRADGALVLVVVCWMALAGLGGGRARILAALLAAGAYVAVMLPWFARSLAVFHAPLPTAGTKAIWLRDSAEFWSYGLPIGPERFWADGIAQIARNKAAVTWANAKDVFYIFNFVLPLFAYAGYRRARERAAFSLVRAAAIYAVLLFAAMCLVFSYPSRFGSLYHSLAGLVPFLMALAPEGIERAALRYAALRNKSVDWTKRFFVRALVGLSAAIAVLFAVHELRPFLGGSVEPWNRRLDHYVAIDAWMRSQGDESPVLVVNPPGFTMATGRASLTIPSNGPAAITAVADRFGARWLVVESNAPGLLETWQTGAAPAGFEPAGVWRDGLDTPVRVFQRVAQ